MQCRLFSYIDYRRCRRDGKKRNSASKERTDGTLVFWEDRPMKGDSKGKKNPKRQMKGRENFVKNKQERQRSCVLDEKKNKIK